MKKILILAVVGVLILSGLGITAVTSGTTLSSQKRLESRESENKETPINPVMVVHVKEIYGTVDDPQYRPLANVTVELAYSVFGIIWQFLWSGTTNESGTTEEVMVLNSIWFKVTVSKDGYHAYGISPSKKVRTTNLLKYDVYFTMAEDGSPFVQQISSQSSQQNSQAQSQSSPHSNPSPQNQPGSTTMP